jgi:3-oxoacyl-(acyl-carrier-protein) synthase
MNRMFVKGIGAVSPAGWGVAAMRAALDAGQPLPLQTMERPGWPRPLAVRLVPSPATRPAHQVHARLRRSSALTLYTVAAALEALGTDRPPGRVGLIACLQSGCVQYSLRFFSEAVSDPATASPLLFPETVFAAPVSHLAALLGNVPRAVTLVGDPAVFLQGVALAGDWLESGDLDAVVVLGAEETNWLHADAAWHLEHFAPVSAGAGALCLTRDACGSPAVELTAVTDAHTYATAHDRRVAAQAMRDELPALRPGELLCEGTQGLRRSDAAETAAWRDWPGARLRLKTVLGEGLMAAAAWQCVAACDALMRGAFPAATVSLVGCNQQAIGARWERA